MSRIPFNLFIEIENDYHILPDDHCSQEENMASIMARNGIYVKYLPQKDGSRFKVIRGMTNFGNRLKTNTIIQRVKEVYKDRENINILPQINEAVYKKFLDTVDKDLGYRYLFYWTHTFQNGVRGFPILLHEKSGIFYNLSSWFREFTPEDNIGVLIKKKEDIALEKLGNPEIIKYLSDIRLCKHCGVVSDRSKPKKDPWMGFKLLCKYYKK